MSPNAALNTTCPRPPIYVRLPNWVGDVCMSLPSLEALLATDRPIVVCARPWARELLSGYPLAGFIDMTDGWRANASAVRRHRREQVFTHPPGGPDRPIQDVGLLLPDSLSSALSFRLAGLHCAGYRDDGRSLILHWPLRKPKPAIHAVASWWHLTRLSLQAWGLPVPAESPPPQLHLRSTRSQVEATERLLHEHNLTPGNFVLIAPTATGLHHGRIKIWPGFAELTRTLQDQGLAVVMCPPPSEAEQALRNAPTARCLPPLPLGAFATLSRQAALVICNDSGVSHLAAAVQAPQLTLFGVTRRERTGPWSPKADCLGTEDQWPDIETVLRAALVRLNGTVAAPGPESNANPAA